MILKNFFLVVTGTKKNPPALGCISVLQPLHPRHSHLRGLSRQGMHVRVE